jgi:hypothetical protein
MKTAAFAIALLLSGAAFAQTTTTTQPDVASDGTTATDTTTTDTTVTDTTVTDTTAPDTTATDTTATDTTATDTMSTGTTATDTMSTGTTSTGTTTNMTVATNVTPPMNPVVQPSNAAPERDARGIPVISDPAVVPSGYNGTTGAGVGGPMVDPATGQTMTGADASYPACTRTVTDNCVQTYERGRRH